MMKRILFLLILLPALALGQDTDSLISKKDIGLLSCRYSKHKKQGGLVAYSVSCSYQNNEYKQITDIGMVVLFHQHEVDSLIIDIENILKHQGEKQTTSFSRDGKYTLTVYAPDMTTPRGVFVYDKNRKYTVISKAQALKLIEWLKTIKIPS